MQNSNERENKYKACMAATILGWLEKTKEVIVAEHSDKSENAIQEVRYIGSNLLCPALLSRVKLLHFSGCNEKD